MYFSQLCIGLSGMFGFGLPDGESCCVVSTESNEKNKYFDILHLLNNLQGNVACLPSKPLRSLSV